MNRLREIERIERTLFTLEWMQNPEPGKSVGGNDKDKSVGFLKPPKY